jgi:predicted PurR-regulated permease PerM
VLKLDDRTGNVLTTIAAFAAVVALVYLTRSMLLAFVLALLLAYLLEPIVGGVERLLPKSGHTRGLAIAIVYLAGVLVAAIALYTAVPIIMEEFHRLQQTGPELKARLDVMSAGHTDLVSSMSDRAKHAVASGVTDATWLLAAPIIAIFFLDNRAALLDRTVDLFSKRADSARAKHTVQQVDEALAGYTRGQLVLAGLSAAFYVIAMMLCHIPYAFALGLMGGALEFVPVVGWIGAAAAILLSGWLAHGQWIWMAVLIGAWRLVQNFVNSPRVMGDRLQMQPLSVFVAMMLGSQIGGIVGAILSIPVVAVCRIVWNERGARDSTSMALVKS